MSSLGEVAGQGSSGGFDAPDLAILAYQGQSLLIPLTPMGGAASSSLVGINSFGQAVGTAAQSGFPGGFIYSHGLYTALRSGGTPVAINKSGLVAGDGSISGNSLAVLYDNDGNFTSLGDLGGGQSSTYSINDSGEVVGESTAVNGMEYAFHYANGVMTKLGGLGGNNSGVVCVAYNFNNSGQIVGYAIKSDNVTAHATLWMSGSITDLGVLGSDQTQTGGTSYAESINNLGQVVGINESPSGTEHGFIYTSTSGLQDLNNVYASLLIAGTGQQTGFTVLTSAFVINDAGQITGQGTFWDGTTTTTGRTYVLNTQILAAAPVISFPSGTYTQPISITLSDATSGAKIYYTTDGTLPDLSSPKYTDPIVLSSSATLNVIAVGSNGAASPLASASYIFPPTTVPAIWTEADIGTVPVAGSQTYSNGLYNLSGSGSGFGGSADSFHFVYQPLAGDGALYGQLLNTSGSAGLMMRQDLTPGSPFVAILLQNGVVTFITRNSEGAVSTTQTNPVTPGSSQPFVLVRTGDVVVAYLQTGSPTNYQLGAAALSTGPIYVGMVDASLTSTATPAAFNGLSLLPSTSWNSSDIGTVQISGTTFANGGTFNLTGSGVGIGSNSDSFHYTYQTMTGDGQITARVASLQDVNSGSEAGVMIRETLGNTSRHTSTVITAGNGVTFAYRATENGNSVNTTISGPKAPYYVRINRTGNLFTSSYSVDGSTWVTIGSTTIPMVSSVYIGLAVCSHNPNDSCAASIDTVSMP